MTESAVVVYLNGKLTYFQPYQGFLYYLAQIVEDLELQAVKYANELNVVNETYGDETYGDETYGNETYGNETYGN
jgi:hypothetical protein